MIRAQSGGHVEIWLGLSDITKKLQITWGIAGLPCAVQIPGKKSNRNAKWLTQPEEGRFEQELIVPIDSGHNPAWADSIIYELEESNEPL